MSLGIPGGIPPHKLKDKLFRIKKFQYNTYEIQHPVVVGTLRLANILTNVMEIPQEQIPPQARTKGVPTYAVGGQTVVSFTNRGKKKEPSLKIPTNEELRKNAKVEELTSFIVDQPFEPWNEYIVQGNPPISLKVRNIMNRLEWYTEYTNQLGDPFLWANQNSSHNVTIASAGEAGLT